MIREVSDFLFVFRVLVTVQMRLHQREVGDLVREVGQARLYAVTLQTGMSAISESSTVMHYKVYLPGETLEIEFTFDLL